MRSEAMQRHKPMAASQVIANYELLSALSVQMRDAAVQGEWDQLVGIEHRRSELVAGMQVLDAEVGLDEAARRRKADLIAGIMVDDAEIRNHIQIWMDRLQHNMQSNRQEQRLLKAYGA